MQSPSHPETSSDMNNQRLTSNITDMNANQANGTFNTMMAGLTIKSNIN